MRALVLAIVLAGCVGDPEVAAFDPDDVHLGDEPDDLPDGLVAGTVRVVQMNPYYAGRLAPYNEHANSCSATSECGVSGRRACTMASQEGCWECIDHACRQRTYETAKHAAGLVDAIRADVVGIQELDPAFAPRIAQILAQATGATWDYRVSAQGIGGRGSGVGVYWRADRISLVADLGHVDVDTLASGYIVRFHGVILSPKGTTKQFGFFSGKLDWNKGEGDRRTAEARRLRSWIDARLAEHGVKTRIVASDFNDTIGSNAYDVFADYDDGDAIKPTVRGLDPDRRIDYLLWADGAAGASRQGFATARSDRRLGRSEFFGSDHRFVYGDARVP
ncbi:MAG TPA: endonuclease/exonuclease/phosphatase family protein [Kofleriaceae bacterium]|nr:endonuclease/exonuclease/phosphatase family protein [Kofleriaceae bacterium]